VSYTYDNNGSTQSKTDSTGTTNYTWDFENRLTSVALPGTGGTVSFKYDPFGRRIQKALTQGTTTTTTNYVYDGDNSIEEVDQNGGVLARYEQGLNIDEPLAMLRGTSTSYYQADGLGSVTSLMDSTGAIKQTYSFDSFGNQTASTGTLINPFRYTAREFDPETNLYFYRARYYDQTTGRFASEDPIGFNGGDMNFYAYVDGSPNDWTDPYGLNKYKCSLFGGCSKKPFGPPKSLKPGCPCKSGARLPDFLNFSFNIGIPQTANIVGLTGSVSLDRYGRLYAGPGINIGKSLGQLSGSLTLNYLNQGCKPGQIELDRYLSKENVTGGAGYGLGFQYGGWPGSGTATGGGLMTPQVGVDGSYSFPVIQFPKLTW
jgi:RHS repeat-associated protein